MQLLTVFLIVVLSVIVATLVIISIKLTDLVAEAKACRIAVQNIEADDLFQQGHFSENQRKELRNHNSEILSLLQRIELLLGTKAKSERPRTTVLASSESEVNTTQARFGGSRTS
jgi:hypothetical protein